MALGSQTKNTVCFLKNNSAFMGPLHKDLTQLDDFINFKKDVKKFLKGKPRIIAYDLHPEYQSNKYAAVIATPYLKLEPVQHHHAHIASCMAEHGLKNQQVIGVAFDGTGLGEDNQIWGAEFLICDYKGFKRAAYLEKIPLIGQEAAITEPWRLTAAWLCRIYKDKFLSLNIDFTKGIDKKKWAVLKKMDSVHFNSPFVSSMGRLFDAAASLIMAKYKAGYEAELAVSLEKLATGYKREGKAYKFVIKKIKGIYIIDPSFIFKGIISDIKKQVTKQEIAYRFHMAVAKIINEICLKLKKEAKIKKVVLSGGVFQNKLLLKMTLDLLYKYNFEVIIHKNLPANDANISLGQAVIASFRSQ